MAYTLFHSVVIIPLVEITQCIKIEIAAVGAVQRTDDIIVRRNTREIINEERGRCSGCLQEHHIIGNHPYSISRITSYYFLHKTPLHLGARPVFVQDI